MQKEPLGRESFLILRQVLLADGEKEISKFEQELEDQMHTKTLDYEFMARKVEYLGDRTFRPWSMVSHLKKVVDSPEMRAAIEKIQPTVVEYGMRVGQSEPLYKAWKTINDSGKVKDPAQKRVVELAVLEASLAGVALKGKDKTRTGSLSSA